MMWWAVFVVITVFLLACLVWFVWPKKIKLITGRKYLIRVQPFYYVGVVKKVTPDSLVLGNASRVTPDRISEVQSFTNDIIIGLEFISLATPW